MEIIKKKSNRLETILKHQNLETKLSLLISRNIEMKIGKKYNGGNW